MRLATLCLPVMGPIIILGGVLQAVGQGMTAMWLSLLRQLGIFLPALIFLPRIWQLNGSWLAFSLSEALSAIVAIFFLVRLWRGLQGGKRFGVFISFKNGYALRRLAAWLKW